MYQANRQNRAGSKAGLNQYDVYRGHSGPVMGLNFHPLHGPVDFSDLFLSCSADWTVKLWRAKSLSKPSSAPQTIAPLYSFDEADDYVYDVQWHPSHPALFGCVDGSGRFDLWNLNIDTEVCPGKACFREYRYSRYCRCQLCLHPSALIAPSTNSSGTARMGGVQPWGGAMESSTSTTLGTCLFREKQSGRIYRRLFRESSVEVKYLRRQR